ncbi:MAG TPA: glycosyltransferase family A protein [Acidimicrobiales bacterium]
MPPGGRLVSIGLPVRNGERHVGEAARSVLAQSYGPLELVISDNASDDATEDICRDLARSDARVRYCRQPRNIGLVENFTAVLHLARGTYFKWLGADDRLLPSYVSRCVEVLDADADLVLVTTQQAHVDPDGIVETARYDATGLRSARPVERFTELLRLLNESHLLLDPLYGMMRREPVSRLSRPVMLFEDQILAARLALTGPFGHVPEVLSYRGAQPFPRLPATAVKLGVPRWQARVATALQCRELLSAVREAGLGRDERRRAEAVVVRFFVRRHQVTAVRRGRRLARRLWPLQRSLSGTSAVLKGGR